MNTLKPDEYILSVYRITSSSMGYHNFNPGNAYSRPPYHVPPGDRRHTAGVYAHHWRPPDFKAKAQIWEDYSQFDVTS